MAETIRMGAAIAGSAALLAGFDAGQTHTTCRLALTPGQDAPGQEAAGKVTTDAGMAVLAEGEGPGVSHLAAAGGPQRFREALAASLAAARTQLPAAWASAPLRGAAVGASGIEQGTPLERQALELATAALELPTAAVVVSGDERTALRGALGCSAGIIVISGTGCICLGRNGAGAERRAGGWGWLLDGAGSAMDIGRDGLSLSLRMADGRCPETALRPALWQALGVSASDPLAAQAIKARVVQSDFGPAGFARLAPMVHDQAAAGDPHAAAILMRSAQALTDMVTAVARGLELASPPVVGLGGALRHLELFRRSFEQTLASAGIAAGLSEPLGDGACGALAMARDQLALSQR